MSWEGIDSEDSEYTIHMFGRMGDGRSVHVETVWKPYFLVKGTIPRCPTVLKKDLWGFQNDTRFTFSKVECATLMEFRKMQKKSR